MNWSAYNAPLKRRGSLMVWLDPELQWQAAPSRRSGRPTVFSDAAIQFCLALKCMFGLGLPNVSTEMSLHVLAYNLKRVMRVLGIGQLMAAMRTVGA